MRVVNNQHIILATNPLHYTYFCQRYPVIQVVGSTRGIIADYSEPLGFNNLALLECENTIEQLAQHAFRRYKDGSPKFIAWKALTSAYDFMGNPYNLAHQLERKSYLRRLLPEAFPAFSIIRQKDIDKVNIEQLKAELVAEALVIQIDFSTGGKGTFVVTDQAAYDALVPDLAIGQDLVISRHIQGTSRGLQCFMDTTTVITLPWWHRDLVGIEGVCSFRSNTSKYCGAVLENVPKKFMAQIDALTQKVQTVLKKDDYYGIFGLDIVVEEQTEHVYLIEINPRVTAVSHVYATAMRALGYSNDFLTAQTEKWIYGKQLDSNFVDELQSKTRPLSNAYYYLKVQNLSSHYVVLNSLCRLGVYGPDLTYKNFGFGINELHSQTDLVVVPESRGALPRAPGERVYAIIGNGTPVDGNNKLQPAIKHILEKVAAEFLQVS